MHQAFCHTFLLSVFNLGGIQISILYCISVPNMYCAFLPKLFILLLSKTFRCTLWKWQAIIMKFPYNLNRIWNVFFFLNIPYASKYFLLFLDIILSIFIILFFSYRLFFLNLLCRHHILFFIILKLLVWVQYSSTYLPNYLNNLTYFFRFPSPIWA